MVNAVDLNREYDLLALASRDTTLRKSGTFYEGPCPFCGGSDRFSVKKTPQGYHWYCRKCGNGKYHTAVDYIMRREHLDFRTAVNYLGGENNRTLNDSPAPRLPVAGLGLPDHAWQSAALRHVMAASDNLYAAGTAGRNYLLERGLHSGTWAAWQLGFAPAYDGKLRRSRAAIVIPWLDMDHDCITITAVKYRFIDGDRSGLRYSCRKGSVPLVFGLLSALTHHDTLLLVEGEINALSVAQCIPEGVSCLSFGSEGGGQSAIFRHLSARYARVFVWADDKKKAAEIRGGLGHRQHAICSPIDAEGNKWDANKMLQGGMLMDFLSHMLKVPCLGWRFPSVDAAEQLYTMPTELK